MAVSYLSNKPFKGSDYVLPVSLDLLSRVNTYKQERFYANADAIKNKYSQLYNSDIINPAQKEYLKNKYNNLTSQIEEWGPVDYSDLNISNQISGFAQDIYDDPIVLRGIASTKQIRTLQASYDKLKTDPKLNKYWSPQNEWWDTRGIQDYAAGGIDAQYNGPSTPTVYKGNPFQLLTAKIKELRPDIKTGIDPTTGKYYFMNSESKVLSPERIFAQIEGQLDPDIANQIKINANYSLAGLTPQDVENRYVNAQNKKVDDIKTNMKNLLQLAQTEVDEEKKAMYLKQFVDNEQDLTEVQNNFNVSDIRNRAKTQSGLEDLKYNLGLQNILDTAVTAYSYKEIKNSLQLNQAKIIQDKLAREDKRIDLAQQKMINDENYREKVLDLKERELVLKAKGDGNSANSDGSNNGFISELGSDTQTEDEVKQANLTTDKINLLLKQSRVETATAIEDLFKNNAASDYSDYVSKIAAIDGQAGITEAELTEAVREGNPYVNMNNNARQWFTNATNAIKQAAAGDNKALNNLNFNIQDVENVSKQIRTHLEESKFYKDLQKQATDYSIKQYAVNNKITEQKARELMNDYNNPKRITEKIEITDPTGVTIITDDKSKKETFTKNFKKLQDTFYDKSEYRQLYNNIYIPSYEFNKFNSDVQAFLKDDKEFEQAQLKTVEPKSIRKIPTTADQFKNGNRYIISFDYKDANNKLKSGQRYINSKQAERFGITEDPSYKLDVVLRNKGELSPFPVVIDLPDGKTALNVKTTYNKGLIQVRVNDIPIKFNGTDFSGFQSAGHAETFITTALKKSGNVVKNQEELLNYIRDISRGKIN